MLLLLSFIFFRLLRGGARFAPLPPLPHLVDLPLQIPDLVTLVPDNVPDARQPEPWRLQRIDKALVVNADRLSTVSSNDS